MQSYVSGLDYSTVWFERRNSTSGTGYYTNNVFPTGSIDPLAYSYLDNYDLDGNGSADFSYQVQGLSGEATPTLLLRGIPTMMRSRTVGQGLSNIWLTRVIFYDKNGRVIQTQGNNQLNSSVANIATNVPDFTRVTMQAKVTKVAASVTTTVLSTFSYDHMYRALAIDQKYNSGSTMRVAAYEYNELGQLVKKNLKQVNSGAAIPYNVTLSTAQSVSSGQTVVKEAQNSIDITPEFLAANGSDFTAKIATNYLQAVDYRYNIRGQMLNINNSKLIDDGGITNNDANDVFGMDMLYNVWDSNLNNTVSYSGRLTAVKWMTRDAAGVKTNERAYRYSYDVLNRMYLAYYAERAGSSTGAYDINSNGNNEADITYDDNGNILTLRRNSAPAGATSHIQVDDLVYTYDTSNPNQLKKVVDGVGANYVSYGFRNLTGSSSDYSYDGAGNLTADPYKGLTLSYNELNRADQITITTATNRYIRYTYNSGGQLIRKQAYDNAVLQKTTDYIDGFVYENSTLAYFAIPEGRVINVSGTLTPEFVITDVQGNARISFRDDGSGKAVVTQENSYYAFGLTFATSPVALPAKPNKNLYNGGSEWQNDFSNLPDYYNTFFRNYDQALGRFISIDPLAEAAESLTGYNYSGNNPIMFNDPAGDRVFRRMPDWDGYNPEKLSVHHGTVGRGDDDGFFKSIGYVGAAAAQNGASTIGAAGGSANGYSVDENGSVTFYGSMARAFFVGLQDGNDGDYSYTITEAGTWSLIYSDAIVDFATGTEHYGGTNVLDFGDRNGSFHIDGSKVGTINRVGQPGEWESVAPIWGPARAAIDNIQTGDYGWAAFNTAMAISDVFLVKAAAVAVGKLAVKGITKLAFSNVEKLAARQIVVHGNSLMSLKPTWGYKLYSTDGTFLKNGITSAVKAESRYTRAFMSDKVMGEKILFPNRAAAYQWEFQQNQILRGPLNLNMH